MPSELGEVVLHVRVSDPHGLLDEIKRFGNAMGALSKALNAGCRQQQAVARVERALESLAAKVQTALGAEQRAADSGCPGRCAGIAAN